MKPYIVFCLLLFGVSAQAQVIDNAPFCPPGATWIGYQRTFGATSYAIYSYDKDTVISGFSCKKINVYEVEIRGNYPNGQYFRGVYPFPPQFWRYVNDSLTAWNGTYFEFWGAYDSTLGQTIGIENSKVSCGISGVPDASVDSFFRVRKKDYVNNGVRYLGCEYLSLKNSFEGSTFLRNIGYRNCPYPSPNFSKCSGGLAGMPNDVVSIGYKDNIRGLINYIPGADTSFLHFVLTSVSEVESRNAQLPIPIYPNPVIEGFTIPEFEKLTSFQIIDYQGKLVHQGVVSSANVDVSFLKSGLYVARFTQIDGSVSITKLVKM